MNNKNNTTKNATQVIDRKYRQQCPSGCVGVRGRTGDEPEARGGRRAGGCEAGAPSSSDCLD